MRQPNNYESVLRLRRSASSGRRVDVAASKTSLDRRFDGRSNRVSFQSTASPSLAFVPKRPEWLQHQPKVAILLATKNGAEFLHDQLQSYSAQTHVNWELFVSDDGSMDRTREIVEKFAASIPQRVTLLKGPCEGFCRNFMSLAGDAEIDGDFFAFSDQDDIWSADKIERALRWLTSIPECTPAVYCGRTELVDRRGTHKGYSRLYAKAPSFQNALVQNIGGGNTMMFNRATKKLLEATASDDVASHDWWTYQIATATGGIVYYDPKPCLKYRQHAGNMVGDNLDIRSRLKRVRGLFSGRLVSWNESNIKALQHIRPLLAPSCRATIDKFAEGRRAPLLTRLRLLRQAGVYRQGLLDNFGLFIACALGRI